MPRFYFDIEDAFPSILCLGEDLPSLTAARRHALQYAGMLLCEQEPPFWDADEWVMTISDENHLTLCTITINTFDAPSVMHGSPEDASTSIIPAKAGIAV